MLLRMENEQVKIIKKGESPKLKQLVLIFALAVAVSAEGGSAKLAQWNRENHSEYQPRHPFLRIPQTRPWIYMDQSDTQNQFKFMPIPVVPTQTHNYGQLAASIFSKYPQRPCTPKENRAL